MGKLVEEFNDYRTKMNDRIMETVGGSILIPHYRRAVEYWDELNLA
ncbi:hypothetical protein [Pedobacter immunditicola]